MKENSLSSDQHSWLQHLKSMCKRPLRVSKNINGRPSQWVSLDAAELPVDYRTVLHNEVVFDIDATQWKKVRLYAEIVIDALNKINIPYIAAYTGGRGVHVHVFFELSEDQKGQCTEIDVMPKDLRMWLFHIVLQEAGVSPKLIGPGNPFDTACVNWSDEGKGHLIRIFGGKKRRHKTLLREIPEERPKDIAFPDDIVLWKIPEKLFQEFIDQFKRSQKQRIDAVKKYHKASQHFAGKYLNLPCIQKILEGLPEGQRNAGARILAIACRLDGVTREDVEKVILEYAGNCSQENISSSEYLGWVNWICTKEKTFWNCRFCKELELCKEGCAFHEAAFKDVIDFLKDPDLVSKIDKILGKRIKRDRKNRMLIFLVYLSAYGSNPLNLFLKGESSIGKTHIAKTVAEYFPEEDVLFIGDMSPKALIHEHGQYQDGKVYISLENKILVFMETPRKETLEMLKPILSHDRTEIEYKIADKRASGQLGTKRVIICGWPATVFCTTDFKYLEELSTRSMLTTPEVSEEKIAQVLKYKASQYSRPWENKENEQERILKEAIKVLRSGVHIGVPYADELAEGYEKSEPRVMRDYDKLMELIKMSAFLHQEQRVPFDIDSVESTFIIATEYDYWIGRLLFEAVRETTVTGIPQPVIDFYKNIICKIEGTINYQSIREMYVAVFRKPLSRTRVRIKFIEPLESIGWLSHEPDPVDGRKKVFEKCRIENENCETTDVYGRSYFKDIFPENKLKEYLEGLEKMRNKNGKNNTKVNSNSILKEKNNYYWFYAKKVPYFLEANNGTNKKINNENPMKKGSSINDHNLSEKKPEYKVEEKELIDHYDEETVLLQIPQEDIIVGDVMRKFKNGNKVADTIVVLQEKKKVITGVMDGQSYIRRLSSTPRKKDPEVNRSRPNTWRCAMCGKRFQAHIPDEDHDGNAICRDCSRNLQALEESNS